MTYGRLTKQQINKLVNHPRFDEFIKTAEAARDEYARKVDQALKKLQERKSQ